MEMFELLRWPGPADANAAAAASKLKKTEAGLSLLQLNARARERAEARRIQAVVNETHPIAGRGNPLSTRGVNGDLDVAAFGRTVGNEAHDLVPRASKKEKKRMRREETSEVLDKLEEVVEHNENKGRKNEKKRVSLAVELDNPEEVLLELADEPSLREYKRPTLINGEIPPNEKSSKKKKKNTEAEPAVRVSTLLLPTSKYSRARKNATDVKSQELSEDADMGLASRTAQKASRKKNKAVHEIVVESQDNNPEVGNLKLLDTTAELPGEKVHEIVDHEFDISRIERDVKMIMGKMPSKAIADGSGKRPPVLPWMRDPVEIGYHKVLPLNQVPGLDFRLQDALRMIGVEALFPVQVAVWHETVGPGSCERDLCVCSPTGSGKTLSYALPIVQKLSTRVLRRLRALIVLPTRDLAMQVKAVFDSISSAVGLNVGLAVGQTSIAAEAAELVKFRKEMVHSFRNDRDSDDNFSESCVDILVATPGRLMDHLRNTKEFTLQHLHYLVVDETDRLLRQSYQDWLSNVLKKVAATELKSRCFTQLGSVSNRSSLRSLQTMRHLGNERGMRGTMQPRFMKMVLSATLTRDPSKIAQLALHCPIYIAQSAVDNCYQLPQQLQAFKMVCKQGEKPLYLVALLQQLVGQQTIVFTASVVATHRLFILLSSFEGLSFKVVEYSSLQHQQARSKSLAKFRERKVQVLIASDAMTRGMDVEGVGNVVNYDMPVYAKTYVHRVGRTARAGRAGCSYTLLRREEVRHFKSLLKKANNILCKDYLLPAPAKEELYEKYLSALEKLKQATQEESASTPAPARKGEKVHCSAEQNVSAGPDELFM